MTEKDYIESYEWIKEQSKRLLPFRCQCGKNIVCKNNIMGHFKSFKHQFFIINESKKRAKK